jgi:hypothetical protein
MTKEELVALEVERRALLETVRVLTKNSCDARMETGFDAFLCSLEDKAAEIQKIIDENI